MTRDEIDDLTVTTLIRAFEKGDIIQMPCIEAATGNKVTVLGVFADSAQMFIPLARLYGPTAYQEVYPSPDIDFNGIQQQTAQEVSA